METVICEKTENGFVVKAPRVGVYSKPPQEGALINSKTNCGIINVLGEQIVLHLPSNVQGVVKFAQREESIAVEYLQELFSVEHIGEITSESLDGQGQDVSTQHQNVVLAPTAGMFYRRPTPEEPTYVNVGDEVKKGQVLGLVEVMKTFNQILYLGDDLPDTGKVKEICVEDGGEVQDKQILFVIE